MNSPLWAVFDLFLIFCATFSGGYPYGHVPIFYGFWLLILLRRRFGIFPFEIQTQVFLALIFLPILARPFLHCPSMYWSGWSLVLYVNVVVFSIQLFERLWQSERSPKLLWLGCFLALVVICYITLRQVRGNPISFLTPRGNQSSRTSYFFGMGIYYRQVGCVFLFILALFWKQYHLHHVEGVKGVLKLMAMLVSLLVSFYLLFVTGSRGATIVGGFILATYAVLMMRISIKWLRFLNGSFLLGLVVLFLRSSYKTTLLNSRLFIFHDPPSSYAIQSRLNYYERIFDFFKNENYMIGVGTKSEGDMPFFYPHNLFLDLLYHAGIVTTVIIIIFMIVLLFQVLRSGRASTALKFYLLVMVPVFIGTMFSGNLYNNFTVATLCVTVPVYLNRVRRMQRLRLLKEQKDRKKALHEISRP